MATTVFLVVAIVCSSSMVSAEDSARIPVPPNEEVDKAAKGLKAAFATQYAAAAKDPQKIVELVNVLSQAAETTDSNESKFAALMQAAIWAARGGDDTRAMQLVAQRAKTFDCDGIKETIAILEQLLPKVDVRQDVSCLLGLYRLAEQAVREALGPDDQIADARAAAEKGKDIAMALAKVGKTLNQKGLTDDGNYRQGRMTRILDSIAKRKKRRAEFLQAKEGLINNREDPALNMVVGQYVCFVLGKRDEGLPFLTKCGDEEIIGLATREIDASRANDPTKMAYFDLAGEWWELAAKRAKRKDDSKSELSVDIKRHAASLYEMVRPGLVDEIKKAEARDRIHEARGDDTGTPRPGFFRSHRLVARQDRKGWQALVYEIEFIDETNKRLQAGQASATHLPGKAADAKASASKAFDGDPTTHHDTGHEPAKKEHWISYEMPYPVRVKQLRIIQYGGDNHLDEVELQGSNDEQSWTSLGTFPTPHADSNYLPVK